MRLPEIGAGLDFKQKLALRSRLEELKIAHTTGLVVTEPQAYPLLDIAAQAGVAAMVELAIAPAEMADSRRWGAVRSRIAHMAAIGRGHRALCGYILDCPLTEDDVRAVGVRRLAARMRRLILAIKLRAPSAMVALRRRFGGYAIDLPHADFLYADVPALNPVELREFMMRLNKSAGARPLVLEFRSAIPAQNDAIGQALGIGVAGIVAPSVLMPPAHDWLGIRKFQSVEILPFATLDEDFTSDAGSAPMVSVVVCARNAERTIRRCMAAIGKLTYPNYEVIVVDDGSSDATSTIVKEFPQVRLIRQSAKGIGSARNVGAHAARGSIIAFIGADCAVDQDWLSLIVRAMRDDSLDGCEGPAYFSHADGRTAALTASSPSLNIAGGRAGADRFSESNMAFTRAAFERVDGFDSGLGAAGSSIDISWRMRDADLAIGYAPAAFVWLMRDSSLGAYFDRQREAGCAEAMLHSRHPARIGATGGILPERRARSIAWFSAIRSGDSATLLSAINAACRATTSLEWALVWTVVLIASLIYGVRIWPAVVLLAIGPIAALYFSFNVPIDPTHAGFGDRILLAVLGYAGSLVRAFARYQTRVRNIRRSRADQPDSGRRAVRAQVRP